MIFKLIKTYNLLLLFTLLALILSSENLLAQSPEAYNKIYTKAYLEISQKDFPRAIQIADSLYNISESPRYKAKSLMLSASLMQQSGEIKNAVEYALKADQILLGSDEYIWKAKISGFLASQYRNLQLYNESKKYIDQTIETVSQINDPRMVNQTMGFIMQEKAYYEIDQKNYNQSVINIAESENYFKLSGQTNDFLTANNEQLLGLSYFHLKDYSKALFYYQHSLDKLRKMSDNFLKALVLNGLAKTYLAKKDPSNAKIFIEEAQKLADESNYLNLKNEIYQTSQKYFALIKDLDNLELNKAKQDSVQEKISVKSSAFINDSYSGLKKKNDELARDSNAKNILLITTILVLLSGCVYFIFYKQRQKRSLNKVKQILKDFEQIKKDTVEDVTTDIIGSEKDAVTPENIGLPISEPSALMTDITEKKILYNLEKFEESLLFTQNTISLPYVAAYCGTNTKYLSYVVNTHKKKDFKNYINELRVRYIILKLKNNSNYQKYKISTLAEEAGFSSQSKFAAAFKKITSVNPSEFLDHLKSQQLNSL